MAARRGCDQCIGSAEGQLTLARTGRSRAHEFCTLCASTEQSFNQVRMYLRCTRKRSFCARRGYDPVHWGVPEGSYASDPDAMVAALHARGLRVVLDVVYNHTFHSARDGAPAAACCPAAHLHGG